jgi:hypothetical protein
MDEDERLNFNSFVDAYNAYQNPNLAPVAPAFAGYGYQAPTMDMMLAPQQMPQMMLDPSAIYDPSVGAAMQILNQPMMIRQAPGLLGAGTDYQNQFGLLQNIAPTRMQQYQRIAAPPPPPPPPVSDVGGGGNGGGGGGGFGNRSNVNDPGSTGMFTDQFGRTVSNNKSIGLQDYQNFGVVQDSSGGFLSDGPHGSIADTGMGVNSQGQTVSNDATIAVQNEAMFGADAAADGGGGKIVCTAMNHAYGFGSFRNRIWLAYSAKHLTKAHEAGYHALFLPLVAVGYNQGDKMHNRIVRRILENIARHRSADLRAEMRGGKRDRVGQAYRFILEPLCYAVGKLKGK